MKIRLSFVLTLLFSAAYGQFFENPVVEPADLTDKPVVLWKFKANGPIVGAPVIDNGTVYVGSTDSCLYAIDLVTGRMKWKLATSGAIRSSVCVNQNRLFLLGTDGFLYRVQKDSGRIDGFFQTLNGFMGDRQHDYADYFSSTPVLMDSTLYFGSGESIYALDLSNGFLRWTCPTGDLVHTTPVISQGKVYAGSFDGNLWAVNLATGQPVWKFKTTGRYTYPKGEVTGNPVAAAGMVIAGARDNNLYAIDVRGGYCNWMRSFPSGWALPVTFNDSVLYVGTSEDRLLYCIDLRTGQDVWKAPSNFTMYGGVAIAKQIGYFATLAGKVSGVDLTTGTILWTVELDACRANHDKWLKRNDKFRDDISKLIKTPLDMLTMYRELGGIFSTPAIGADHLVVAGYDGTVYCLTRAPDKEGKKEGQKEVPGEGKK